MFDLNPFAPTIDAVSERISVQPTLNGTLFAGGPGERQFFLEPLKNKGLLYKLEYVDVPFNLGTDPSDKRIWLVDVNGVVIVDGFPLRRLCPPPPPFGNDWFEPIFEPFNWDPLQSWMQGLGPETKKNMVFNACLIPLP